MAPAQGLQLPEFPLPSELAKSDPLLKLLLKIRLSPLLMGILISVLIFLVRLPVAWAEGHLFTTGGVLGYLSDLSLYVHLFRSTAVIGFYIWIPAWILEVVASLIGNGVILEKNKDYQYADFFSDLKVSFNSRWVSILLITIVILVMAVFLLPVDLANRATSATLVSPLSFILTVLEQAFTEYVVFRLLLNCFLGIVWFRRLFSKFTIRVRPLHPDGAGGLSPLGNLALRLSYLISVIGISLVLSAITRNLKVTQSFGFLFQPDIIAGLIAYAILSPVVFFAPLAVAHHYMEDAKKRFLLQIDEKFGLLFSEIQASLNSDSDKLILRNKRFKKIRSLHAMGKSFPVWPFNIENVTRFITTYLLPIILVLIADALLRLFNL